MARMRRPWSPEDVAKLWTRWQRGEYGTAIAQAFDRAPPVVYQVIRRRGGFAPPTRRRAARTLTLRDREEISRQLAQGAPLAAIARQLQRPPCTVSREVRRHGGREGYRAAAADQAAWTAAARPKACRLATRPALRALVTTKLAADWSPQQIAGWLKVTYPQTPDMQISHETIYRSLFIQSRGVLKKSLQHHLRRRRTTRRPLTRPAGQDGRGQLPDLVSIRDRPPSVEDRAVPGHWEGDLLSGARHTHVATLVERTSRYVMVIRLPSHDTDTVVRALTREVQKLPRRLWQSLTWDRGKELAAHRRFTVATDVQVYFCDPQSPWQRGSNENTNGLLRQYLPKGTDLSTVSQRQLDRIARRLNERPRMTLGYKTPADMLASIVASTG